VSQDLKEKETILIQDRSQDLKEKETILIQDRSQDLKEKETILIQSQDLKETEIAIGVIVTDRGRGPMKERNLIGRVKGTEFHETIEERKIGRLGFPEDMTKNEKETEKETETETEIEDIKAKTTKKK